MSDTNIENRIVELEVRVSFQDSMIESLNSVVITQQKELDLLKKELDEMKAQLLNPQHPDQGPAKPPHY